MAIEEYGHDRHRRIIAESGLQIVPLPVDDEGAAVARLEGLDVAAVLLTPAHQFPIGVPLAPDRRRAAVEWARATGGLILEDDYDGEFRYDRRSIGALQSLAPESVLYLGTASKALAPGVGLAWAAVPRERMPALVRQRELDGGTVGGILQLTLAAFMDAHEYDRAVRRRRATFRTRREALAGMLRARVPEARVRGLAAGLQCLVELPDAAAEQRAVAAALARGVALEGLSAFRVSGEVGASRSAGVVVGYGALRPLDVDRGLALAVEAIAEGDAASRNGPDSPP